MCDICDALGQWVCWCGCIGSTGEPCANCGRAEADEPSVAELERAEALRRSFGRGAGRWRRIR